MNSIKKILLKAETILVAVSLLLLAVPVSAANVSMSLNPSTTSVTSGSNFTINVLLSTGSARITDVVGQVNFNKDQVQFISADYSPSASWGTLGPEVTSASGYYRFDVLTSGSYPSGNLTIVRLTFKALASSGAASFTISNASVGDADSPPPAVHNLSLSGTSVNLQPVPQQTSSPTPSSPSGGNSNPGGVSPTSQPTEQEIQANTQVDDEAPVVVENFSDSTSYIVEITVLDRDGNTVGDTEVKLNEMTASTNENGIAEFEGVKAGQYTVEALGTSNLVTVVVGDADIPQKFTVQQADDKSNIAPYIIAAALLVGALIGGSVIKRKLQLRRSLNSHVSGDYAYTNNSQDNLNTPKQAENSDEYLKADSITPPETIVRPEEPKTDE